MIRRTAIVDYGAPGRPWRRTPAPKELRIIGAIFLYSFMALVLYLSYSEVKRYRTALVGDRELAYPRRRLIRRLSIALLIMGILLVLRFLPRDLPAGATLLLYGLCMIASLFALGLALRDMQKTSQAAIREHTRFEQDSKDQLTAVLKAPLKSEKKSR